MKATEKSDVYSLGIVLMELVSGRMPTDGTFGAHMDMVRWVESRIETSGAAREELVDSILKPLLPNEETTIFQVLDIALECTRTSPAERPSSRQVGDQLLHIYNAHKLSSAKKGDSSPYL